MQDVYRAEADSIKDITDLIPEESRTRERPKTI